MPATTTNLLPSVLPSIHLSIHPFSRRLSRQQLAVISAGSCGDLTCRQPRTFKVPRRTNAQPVTHNSLILKSPAKEGGGCSGVCQREIRKENKQAGSGKCFCFPHSGVIALDVSEAAKGFTLKRRERGYSDFIRRAVGRALFFLCCVTVAGFRLR